VKIARFIPLVIIPLLFACFPKKPEIPMVEVPSGPLMEALEQHSRAFSSMKAIAGVRVVRKDRRRSFESVGILINGRNQFRMEAYGPLGQTLVTLLWNGNDLFLEMGGQRRTMQPGSSGLERVLGADVDPGDLSSIFSGNIPGILSGPSAALLCTDNNSCILELRRENTLVKVYPDRGWGPALSRIPPYQVYRDGKLVYAVKFDSHEEVSGYLLPKRVIVENPEKRISLIVEYEETEVNVPVDDQLFHIPESGSIYP
jgi:hypothetical protein